MNRKEFLKQLEELLSDIPEAERRDAMNYYQNYFDDAGVEQEQTILEELGSPEKVAESIKRDLFGENYDAYVKAKQEKQQETIEKQQRENRTLRNILIVVALVLTFPIWIGLVALAFGILVTVFAGLFGVAVAVIAVVAACLFAGVAVTVIGMINAVAGFPAVGLIVIAGGLLVFMIGILGVVALVWIFGRIFPWLIRAIVRLCKRPFQKRGASI